MRIESIYQNWNTERLPFALTVWALIKIIKINPSTWCVYIDMLFRVLPMFCDKLCIKCCPKQDRHRHIGNISIVSVFVVILSMPPDAFHSFYPSAWMCLNMAVPLFTGICASKLFCKIGKERKKTQTKNACSWYSIADEQIQFENRNIPKYMQQAYARESIYSMLAKSILCNVSMLYSKIDCNMHETKKKPSVWKLSMLSTSVGAVAIRN